MQKGVSVLRDNVWNLKVKKTKDSDWEIVNESPMTYKELGRLRKKYQLEEKYYALESDADLPFKYGGGVESYADLYGGEVFLISKGYDKFRTIYSPDGFEPSLYREGIKPNGDVGIYFYTELPTVIEKKDLEKMSKNYEGKNVELFTNAGVDLHSSAKGVFKNITIHRLKINYAKGGVTDFIENSESIKNNGYYSHIKNLDLFVGANTKKVPHIKSLVLLTYNSGGQKDLKVSDTINSIELSRKIAELLNVEIDFATVLVHEHMTSSVPFETKSINVMNNENIIVADRDNIVHTNINDSYADGGGVGEPYDNMTKYQIEKEYKKLNEKRDLLKNKYRDFKSDEILENEKEIDKIITLLYGKDFSGIGQKFRYAEGGGVAQFPPKGELTNKDNFLLKYEKRGGEYEFLVYKPTTKEVSGYNQIKHVCLNKDCPQKMTYEQFINYLYAEFYLDDNKYADGGGVDDEKMASDMTISELNDYIDEKYIPEIEDAELIFSFSETGFDYDIKNDESRIGIISYYEQQSDYNQESLEKNTIYKVNGWEIVREEVDPETEEVYDSSELEELTSDNTYNFSYLGMVDLNWRMYYDDIYETYFIIMHPHLGGDPRGNYGKPFIIQGDDKDELISRFYSEFISGTIFATITLKDGSVLKFDSEQDSMNYRFNFEEYESEINSDLAQELVNDFESFQTGKGDEFVEKIIDGHYTHSGKSKKYSSGGGVGLDDAPSIYVEILGTGEGKWMSLEGMSDGDEVMTAIQEFYDELNEEDGGSREEYRIADMEGFGHDVFYSEYMSESDFDDLLEAYELFESSDYPYGVVRDYANEKGIELKDAIEGMSDSYYGAYGSLDDFAYQMISEGVYTPSINEVFVSDTDKRIISNEEADNYVSGMSNDEIISYVEKTDEYQEKLDDLQGQLDELESEKESIESSIDLGDEKDIQHIQDLLVDKEEEIELLEEKIDNLESEFAEELKDEAISKRYDEVYSELDNNLEGFLQEYGYENYTDANFVIVDYNEVADNLKSDYSIFEDDGKYYIFIDYKNGGKIHSVGTAKDYNYYVVETVSNKIISGHDSKKEANEHKAELKKNNKKLKLVAYPRSVVEIKYNIDTTSNKSFADIESFKYGGDVALRSNKKESDYHLWKTNHNVKEKVNSVVDKSEKFEKGGDVNPVNINRPRDKRLITTHRALRNVAEPFRKSGSWAKRQWLEADFGDGTGGAKFEGGGDVEFIKYNGEEIMYSPHFETYYVNDSEFETLEEAKEFIDKGSPTPDWMKDAYRKGLFNDGGQIEPKLNFGEFKETLHEYEVEGGFGKSMEKGFEMYYLPNDSKFLKRKFKHRDKRKAYKEYLELYKSMFEKTSKDYESGGQLAEISDMFPSAEPMSIIEPMERGGEIKKGDFVKKKGSNLELKVVEVGNDWRSGYDYIKIYNDVTDSTMTLIDWSDYELVYTYADGGKIKIGDDIRGFGHKYGTSVISVDVENKTFSIKHNDHWDSQTVSYPFSSVKLHEDFEDADLEDEEVTWVKMEKGGYLESQNKAMLENDAVQIEHHSEELNKVVPKTKEVPAWVIGKTSRINSDLSDVTHYLDGEVKRKGKYSVGGAIYPDLSLRKADVVNDSIVLDEFQIKKMKNTFKIDGIENTKISSSNDAVKILRKIFGKDTINAYEQSFVLYLNKNNKVIGYYHHSSGGIDGTVMDVQMISGMALKSLAKGVIIAHNHPSENTNPSEADKRITTQLKDALKLFNILLLDSIILTDNSFSSFADEGLLFSDGGTLELPIDKAHKVFHLPLESSIYVPSTINVNETISPNELQERVDQVKEFLGNLFGGYTSNQAIGGFVDSKGELVNEDVIKVTSFAEKDTFEKHKETLLKQLSKWAKEWGQEAIGYEFEGDLYYVPENYRHGGSIFKK